MQRTELVAPAAAAAVVLTAVLGGGFYPGPRMVVGLTLIVVWAVAAARSRGRASASEWWLLGLVSWGLVSAVLVRSSPLAAKETLLIWVSAVLLFGVCRRGSESSRRWALRVLSIGAAVVAASVVVEAAADGLRVGGFFENPNVAAGLMVPTLPLGWWLLRDRPPLRWGWSCLVVAGIVGTGSRAGLLAMVVAAALIMPRGRIRKLVFLAGSLMATGVLIVRFVSQPDALAWHRISIWWAVLKIWAVRPLTGVGPGGLVEAAGPERILHPDEIGRYQFVVGYAESTPLAILVQLGLVGAVLAVLAASIWWFVELRETRIDRPVVVSSVSAVVMLAAFHDFLTIDPVLWWWAVLLGGSTGPPRARTQDPSGSETVPLRWIAAMVMIWLTLWGIVTPSFARRTMESGSFDSSDVIRVLRIEPWLSIAPSSRVRSLLADDGRWTWEASAEALTWARTAVDVHPGLSRLWADLGRVHLRILTDLGGTEHDVEAARRALTRACELDPHLPWNWLERARLERLAGNGPEAKRLTLQALSEEPNTIRGWLMLSRLELEAGRTEEARSALENAENRSNLRDRQGLSAYDLDLLHTPRSQVEALRRALGRPTDGGS